MFSARTRHHGHEFARRTYYFNGRAYDRYYRGYSYHGVYMQVYAPVRYYPVGFYGWAYNPWVRPVVYPMGLGWQSLVRLLRLLFHALPGVRDPCALADGLYAGD